MKWNVDDLPCFVAVADLGGISAAARALNIPKSSVSRILSRLEDGLGLQLFVRGSRALRLTHDGAQFYRHAGRILEQVDAATAELAGLGETPRGRLTVALPMAFGREIVGPRLSDFQARYPDIRLDVRIGSRLPDPLREQIDVAVVVGMPPDSDLIQQRLIDTPLVWIADPQTARSLPETFVAEPIGKFIRAVETRYATGSLLLAGEDAVQIRMELDLTKVMQINDPLIVRDLVAAGGGCPSPRCYIVKKRLKGRTCPDVSGHENFGGIQPFTSVSRAPSTAHESPRLYRVSEGHLWSTSARPSPDHS